MARVLDVLHRAYTIILKSFEVVVVELSQSSYSDELDDEINEINEKWRQLFADNIFFYAIRVYSSWLFSQDKYGLSMEEYKLYLHLFEAFRIFNIMFEGTDMMNKFKEGKEIKTARTWIWSFFFENLEFTISKIAKSLIKIDPPEKKDITFTAINNLLKSKVMSGGLKSKCFSLYFSQHKHIFEI